MEPQLNKLVRLLSVRRHSDDRACAAGALVVVALLVAIIVAYGTGEVGETTGYPVVAVFNKVDGLTEGAEVRMSGMQVGTVVDQRLDEHYRAVVTLDIKPGVAIPNDTSAAIQTDGLFGAKHVVLEPGGSLDFMRPGDRVGLTQDALVVEDLLEMIIAQGKAKRAEEAGEGDQGGS